MSAWQPVEPRAHKACLTTRGTTRSVQRRPPKALLMGTAQQK